MSPTDETTRGDVRKAIGDLLVAEWRAANALGYGFSQQAADFPLTIHLNGSKRTDKRLPQITFVDVSRAGSIFGAAGDGSGPVTRFDGRIDCRIFVGTAEQVPGGEAPAKLAKQLALEAERIVLKAHDGVSDPADGSALAYRLTVIEGAIAGTDPNEPDEHRGDVEIGYNEFAFTPE